MKSRFFIEKQRIAIVNSDQSQSVAIFLAGRHKHESAGGLPFGCPISNQDQRATCAGHTDDLVADEF